MLATSPEGLAAATILFHSFTFISFLCSLFLLAVQLRLRKNAMAIIMCILMSLMYLIVLGFAVGTGFRPHLLSHQMCLAEAFSVNFLFLSSTVLLSLIIFDNCLYALHLKESPESVRMSCPWYYMATAVVFPIIPAVLIAAREDLSEAGVVQPSYLYASFSYVYLISTGSWVFIFGLLGGVSAVTILYKTIRVRSNTIKQFQKSHIPKSALYRWGFGAVVYISFALLSSVPSIVVDLAQRNPVLKKYLLVSPSNKDVYSNIVQQEESLQFILYPKLHFFMLSMLGLVVFALFGTSQQARGASRELWLLITCKCFGLLGRSRDGNNSETTLDNVAGALQHVQAPSAYAQSGASGDHADATSNKTSSTISQGKPRARRLLSIDSSVNEFRRSTQAAIEPSSLPTPLEEEPVDENKIDNTITE